MDIQTNGHKHYALSYAVYNQLTCHLGRIYIDVRSSSQLGGNKMDQGKTEALMDKLDTDGDGKITLAEFRELFNKNK